MPEGLLLTMIVLFWKVDFRTGLEHEHCGVSVGLFLDWLHVLACSAGATSGLKGQLSNKEAVPTLALCWLASTASRGPTTCPASLALCKSKKSSKSQESPGSSTLHNVADTACVGGPLIQRTIGGFPHPSMRSALTGLKVG